MSTNAKPYKETLNLPATRFEMKANLTAKEPKLQQQWVAADLYGQIRKARAGRPRRVLHDGPPYANGEIHMGHLLNKVLKDFVVRSLTMRGFDSPYVPGWDCHGLPIEHKVMKDLGPKAVSMSPTEIRGLCRDDALKWVNVQRDQFKRLGVEGDWDNPYLTLDPRYEAGILDVLADLLDKDLVFRQFKPIHWCITDRTALAEAELEYKDDTTTSIYVNFPMVGGVPESFGPGPWHAMIWTTTPWTLPANVAIAVHPDLEYEGLHLTDLHTGEVVQTIVATELAPKVIGLRRVGHEVLGYCTGRELEHATYRHPFVGRHGKVVLAKYVSVDDGTGLVHTAPGHGAEDYQTGRAYNLPTLSPVDAGGRFFDDNFSFGLPEAIDRNALDPNDTTIAAHFAGYAVPDALFDADHPVRVDQATSDRQKDKALSLLQGKTVFAANPIIIQLLRDEGALFHEAPLKHSYPHCWRCKKPVIFRATEQWFVGVDRNDLRGKTLKAIDQVTWLPAWGRSRIDAMVSQRPDWCISRQRSWGVPIPAFVCITGFCHELLLSVESVRHIRDIFLKHGADVWHSWDVDQLLPPGTVCPKCGNSTFVKEYDILDVWFESGSSHRSVLDEASYGLGGSPAFMYLEGSDQHRGWFQSSILTSVGSRGRAPFETVLTHGFVVDEKGEKMSKSVGNTISAVKATEQYGADVLRLYVASMDYADDVRMSERGIKEMSEAYRKIRNTFRYLLGNLGDYARFDPDTVPDASLHEIDRWALGQLNRVIRDVHSAYEAFEFYRVHQRIYQFCSVTLSSLYLDVLKDRLYAEAPASPDRRAAQFVLARLHDSLTRLLAPIVPHTAEELWDFLPKSPDRPASVHLAEFPEPDPRWDDPARDARWATLLAVRDEVLRVLEKLRAGKVIGSAQEALVRLDTEDAALKAVLTENRELLTTLAIVSDIVLDADLPGDAALGVDLTTLRVHATRSPHAKCQRCWNLRPGVGRDAAHPTLCARCVGVVATLTAGPA
jgi:isoleucyl-tRNA synthetase